MSLLGRSRLWNMVLLLALALSLMSASLASAPRRASAQATGFAPERGTPLAVQVTMADMPAVGDKASVSIAVNALAAAPNTHVDLVASDGVTINGQSHFEIELAAGQ